MGPMWEYEYTFRFKLDRVKEVIKIEKKNVLAGDKIILSHCIRNKEINR